METLNAGPSPVALEKELLTALYVLPSPFEEYEGMKFVSLQAGTIVLLNKQAGSNQSCPTQQEIHRMLPEDSPVYIVQDGANTQRALKALRSGQFECCDASSAARILSRTLRTSVVEPGSNSVPQKQQRRNPDFVFRSAPMQKLDFEISRAARFDFDVLLCGETGVGKDLVAAEIHRRSTRSGKAYVPVALRSLSPTLIESELFGHERGAFSGAEHSKLGKFEAAQGGTIYIPEISCLSEEIQLKLLYFMQYKRCLRVGEDPRHQEHRCDVRMILATNDDMEKLVEAGKLREDFYYRIKGLSLSIPPLRDRCDDVEALAQHFLNLYGFGNSYEISNAALTRLRSYRWPGNVRELENLIKAIIPFCDDFIIDEGMLPFCEQLTDHGETIGSQIQKMTELPTYAEMEENLRTAYFNETLRRSDFHIPSAAKAAGMSAQGFRKALRRIKDLGSMD